MNTPRTEPRNAGPVRPLYWSIRRELWEHRWVYLAPVTVATLVVAVSAIATTVHGLRPHQTLALEDGTLQAGPMSAGLAYSMIFIVGFIVAFLYCTEALHGERRDRSVVFWRSLPVSDFTAVLSKTAVAIGVVPLLTFGLLIIASLVLWLTGKASPAPMAGSNAMMSTMVSTPVAPMRVFVAVIAGGLLQAPLFGWLLLVSVAVRRAPILWAMLPPIVIGIIERLAFGSSHIDELLSSRGLGAYWQPFAPQGKLSILGDVLVRPVPASFFLTPDLWLGVLVAAAFIAAAVRLRRHHVAL